MSLATSALRTTAPRVRRREAPKRVLTAVPSAAPSHGGMLIVCAGLLLSGLLTLLFLNTALAEGSFKVHELQRTTGELADAQAALEQQLTAVSSPAALADQASRLGMVPAESPAFLDLKTGTILGVAAPATEEGAFSVVVTPPRQAAPLLPAAKPSATTTNTPQPDAGMTP